MTTDRIAGLFAKVARLEPQHLEAIDVLVSGLARESAPPSAGVTGLTLAARLEAAHPCATAGRGFEQLPPADDGVRRWRCQGCGAIVTLPEKPEPPAPKKRR
jgi:hypothetical protein